MKCMVYEFYTFSPDDDDDDGVMMMMMMMMMMMLMMIGDLFEQLLDSIVLISCDVRKKMDENGNMNLNEYIYVWDTWVIKVRINETPPKPPVNVFFLIFQFPCRGHISLNYCFQQSEIYALTGSAATELINFLQAVANTTGLMSCGGNPQKD